jgi:hypothetical protein
VGPRRIVHELARTAAEGSMLPEKSTVYRILRRHGLIEPGRRRRKRRDYRRWERETPMALWQIDIVGGLMLADGTEGKVVTAPGSDPNKLHSAAGSIDLGRSVSVFV